MFEFDAYLAYASEDLDEAIQLRDALQARGLKIWHDQVDMLVGPSIRVQMERGLQRSAFGVVLVAPGFFTKKWTQEELDGLFALEEPGTTRILPVWRAIDAQQVRDASPMLAARRAAVWTDDVSAVADELTRSILDIASSHSLASLIRLEIVTGLDWVGPVELYHKSFDLIDRNPGEFIPTDLRVWPEKSPIRNIGGAQLAYLPELHAQAGAFDGRWVSTLAHQLPGTVQFFADRGPASQLWEDAPHDARLASYVFRMRSALSHANDLTYVHVFGPHQGRMSFPACPQDWLTGFVGVIVARGHTGPGKMRPTSYVVAGSVMYAPKAEMRESLVDKVAKRFGYQKMELSDGYPTTGVPERNQPRRSIWRRSKS